MPFQDLERVTDIAFFTDAKAIGKLVECD